MRTHPLPSLPSLSFTRIVATPLTIARPTMRLELLGGARYLGPAGPVDALEKKTAGVLAYLALEGPTSRSRLAGLLWPESRELTARNNLSQTLRRLRNITQETLVVGEDTLSLLPTIVVDACTLEDAYAGDAPSPGRRFAQTLLERYDYDACVDFEAWLGSRREHLARTVRRMGEREADRAESEGRLGDAIAWAEHVVAFDRLSEVAHRRLMRLFLVRGDGGAAISAYERCCKLLARDLGIRPHFETVALAEEIRARAQGAQSKTLERMSALQSATFSSSSSTGISRT